MMGLSTISESCLSGLSGMEDDTPRLEVFLKRLPATDSFCGLIDVDTGTIIIGFVGMVCAIIWFIIDVVYLSIVTDIMPYSEVYAKDLPRMDGILSYDLLLQVGLTLSFVFLILGYKKKNPRYIRGWLVTSVILITGKVVSTICFAFFKAVFVFIISLFYTVFHIYYFFVVNTYYQDMDDGGRHY